MKDLVDMLMGYRTWVKIVVIALIFYDSCSISVLSS